MNRITCHFDIRSHRFLPHSFQLILFQHISQQGTIIAEGGNGVGVVGMIPDTQGICMMIARVFDERGTQDESHIMAAVEWCVDNGARGINMSLGGDDRDDDEEKFFSSLWDEGVMVIAAAGNNGDKSYKYPASYPNILSVAAVDENFEKAPFSVENDEIDLSGPGEIIYSHVYKAQSSLTFERNS